MLDRGKGRFAAQFLKFNMVGLVNTAIDFMLFSLLLFLGAATFGAQVISYAAGTLNSYVMNKRFTFYDQAGEQDGRSIFRFGQFIRFAALNGAVLVLSLIMLFVLVSVAGFPPLASKAIVTAGTVCLNFVGSRQWVFAGPAYRHLKGRMQADE
ncbi:GtrA family protein [Paenibacillus ihumii]|uniref:GtrA family protein n=1 Tax=Paenibacillus ihumii TaxID=687436 RepID=UPI0006D8498F|nr:GtrA family protein [Paenibacillus ihumii]